MAADFRLLKFSAYPVPLLAGAHPPQTMSGTGAANRKLSKKRFFPSIADIRSILTGSNHLISQRGIIVVQKHIIRSTVQTNKALPLPPGHCFCFQQDFFPHAACSGIGHKIVYIKSGRIGFIPPTLIRLQQYNCANYDIVCCEYIKASGRLLLHIIINGIRLKVSCCVPLANPFLIHPTNSFLV